MHITFNKIYNFIRPPRSFHPDPFDGVCSLPCRKKTVRYGKMRTKINCASNDHRLETEC